MFSFYVSYKICYPDDGLFIRLKALAPLNSFLLSCVDCHYVIIYCNTSKIFRKKLCNKNANVSSQTRDVSFPWSTLRTWLLSGAWRLESRHTGTSRISQITQRNICSSGMSLTSRKVTGHRCFETKCWSFFFLDNTSVEEQTLTLTRHFGNTAALDTASYHRKTDTSATQLRKPKNY